MTTYRFRGPRGEWVAGLTRDEAIRQCSAMVRDARGLRSAFVSTGDPLLIVAFVTNGNASDEELRWKLDLPFVEIVRVTGRSDV